MNTPSRPSSIPEGPSVRLGRYELMFKIASGGMATVHLARMRGQGDFMRLFAIKRIHPHLREIPELTRDLLHEASIAGRIRHPNVVPVLDAIDDGEETFLVMEYVEGDSLAGLLRRSSATNERMPIPVVLRIMDDMLAGLQTAHELTSDDGKPLGIVHRDVSPQNVLVGVDGITRLTDFGIAKATSRPSLTATGFTKGKVAYMPPEQARGKALDARADIWSAGVVLWEMLTGERLYQEGDDVAIALVLVSDEPRRLRTVRADLPVELEDAVHSALQKEVADRCSTVAELRDRLRAAMRDHASAAVNADVAAIVNRHAGSSIAKRRARIEEARKVAHEPETTAPLLIAASSAETKAHDTETGAADFALAQTKLAGGTVMMGSAIGSSPNVVAGTSGTSGAFGTEDQVSSSNVAVQARAPLHKKPLWIAAAAVLVLGLVGVVAAAGLRSSGAKTTGAGGDDTASASAASASSGPRSNPAASSAESAAASSGAVADADAGSPSPSTAGSAGSRRPSRGGPPPKGTGTGRKLMPNPYKDPP